jgi:hypothetical protein
MANRADELRSLVVMISITGAQRDILLNPIGNNIWSGQDVQSLNSHAITWSLAKELYGPSGPYFIIPMGIFIGFAITVLHWLFNKVKAEVHCALCSVLTPPSQRWQYIGPVKVDRVILPLIFQYSGWLVSAGALGSISILSSLGL